MDETISTTSEVSTEQTTPDVEVSQTQPETQTIEDTTITQTALNVYSHVLSSINKKQRIY